MTLADFFMAVNQAGVRLNCADGHIQLRGPAGAITPEIRAGAAEHKTTLLSLLSAATAGNGKAAGPIATPSGSAPVRGNAITRKGGGGPAGRADAPPTDPDGPGLGYTLVRDAAGLGPVLAACAKAGLAGLDIETTGLDPRTDRARLLQLVPDSGPAVYVLDLFALPAGALAPLFEVLAAKEVITHNALFDLSFLWALGFRPGKVCDLMVLSRLLTAGTPDGNALADLAARELGVTLDKGHQKGDWSARDLTGERLAYAALDAKVTRELHGPLTAKIAQAGLSRVAAIEHAALPAWLWLARSGVLIDRDAWLRQARQAEARAAELSAKLDALAPPRPGKPWNWASPAQVKQAFGLAGVALDGTSAKALAGVNHPLAGLLLRHKAEGTADTRAALEAAAPPRPAPAWNWDSPVQLREALRLLGIDVPDTEAETLAAADHAFAQAAAAYKAARHHVSHHGRDFLRWLAGDGRVYANWVPLGNDAGRSSCKGPNLQGIAKDGGLRSCFVAPSGRVLVKADWSQLHLRIVATIAGENVMLDAFRTGQDLHTALARKLTGKPEVTAAERKLAKAVNFGLLYGMSAARLRSYALMSYGVDLTAEEAQRARQTFFATYPAIARWHREVWLARGAETRSLCGRRRLCDARTWLGHRLSSPALGTEADALKIALAYLWQRRDQAAGAFPVLAVHDELVCEADADQAEAAAAWLKAAMTDALGPLIEPVPVEVEVTIARTWEGGP